MSVPTPRFRSGLFLCLLSAISLTDSAALAQSKPSADRLQQIDRMIDAMASRNKPPKLVQSIHIAQQLALFSADFDWSDQDRVQKAIKAVQEDGSSEMWWRLRDHILDNRYALTFNFDDQTRIGNLSVGYFCSKITMANLKAAYTRHLSHVPGSMPSGFAALSETNEKNWAGKPLHELQIEVCK